MGFRLKQHRCVVCFVKHGVCVHVLSCMWFPAFVLIVGEPASRILLVNIITCSWMEFVLSFSAGFEWDSSQKTLETLPRIQFPLRIIRCYGAVCVHHPALEKYTKQLLLFPCFSICQQTRLTHCAARLHCFSRQALSESHRNRTINAVPLFPFFLHRAARLPK